MRVLIDTHAMYWYVEGDPKLSKAARAAIQDATNDVLISPASYWEMAIKLSLGKWKLHRPYEEFIDIVMNRYGFQVLPILPAHTARLIAMPFHHRDPFDRLLAAQTLVENVSIVSDDGVFDAYGVTRIW